MAGRVTGEEAGVHADAVVGEAHEISHFGAFVFGAWGEFIDFDIDLGIDDVSEVVDGGAVAAAFVPLIFLNDAELAGWGGVVFVAGGEPRFADQLVAAVEEGGLEGAVDADAGGSVAGAAIPVADDVWGGGGARGGAWGGGAAGVGVVVEGAVGRAEDAWGHGLGGPGGLAAGEHEGEKERGEGRVAGQGHGWKGVVFSHAGMRARPLNFWGVGVGKGSMEIRDFAEKVLEANTLEEKLWAPEGRLTDEAPGAARVVAGEPGRPVGLHFAARGERVRLPRGDELEGAEARAVLLHAFANHELLAVELMALALLKFPEAPAAFRRGLVHTMREEQEHTRLYMGRMAEGGLALGDLPVNGFFWKGISGMATPLEYVSHLSLTFEQANLDYARHYGGLFQRIGDRETGDLLERIYRDEIAHVGYGLKWFRRWKDPARGDWEAWQDTMVFPLSPARAKGNAPFNREGRVLAGFGEAFIENLDLYSQSRGRTPWVGVFNPAAEACALSGEAATARQEDATAVLGRDLDVLPLFSLHREDVVLVRRVPSGGHLRRLREAGVELPQFELLGERGEWAEDSPLLGRKLGRLRPWGWSADSAALLGPRVGQVGDAVFASAPWDEEIRGLYAKTGSAGAARHLGQERGFPRETWGAVAEDVGGVAAALAELGRAGHGRACLKAPFGMAGRGMIQVKVGELGERELTWLRGVLEKQGGVVVEAWLDRVADFSCQYELVPGERPRLKGQVRLRNDAGGRFLGCEGGPSFAKLLPPEAARCLQESGAEELYRGALPALLEKLPGLGRLHGSLGIDAFVYRDLAGAVRLRPLVEINPRTTMGRVTLDLRRWVDPAQRYGFRVPHRRAVAAAGFGTLPEYARHLRECDPVRLGETSAGRRMTGGSLVLNDADVAEGFLGILSVGQAGGS